MRLLQPDVGEVLDRLSILDLKIPAGMLRGVSTEGWEREKAELDTYLNKKVQMWQSRATADGMTRFSELNAQLRQINAKLWEKEDELRLVKKRSPIEGHILAEMGLVAGQIADLNDARCNAVVELNELFGGDKGGGKIYV